MAIVAGPPQPNHRLLSVSRLARQRVEVKLCLVLSWGLSQVRRVSAMKQLDLAVSCMVRNKLSPIGWSADQVDCACVNFRPHSLAGKPRLCAAALRKAEAAVEIVVSHLFSLLAFHMPFPLYFVSTFSSPPPFCLTAKNYRRSVDCLPLMTSEIFLLLSLLATWLP